MKDNLDNTLTMLGFVMETENGDTITQITAPGHSDMTVKLKDHNNLVMEYLNKQLAIKPKIKLLFKINYQQFKITSTNGHNKY